MKVYVLEAGSYDERWIVGVFSSAAAARAAWNPARSERYDNAHIYEWGGRDRAENELDADWGDYATVGEYEVGG